MSMDRSPTSPVYIRRFIPEQSLNPKRPLHAAERCPLRSACRGSCHCSHMGSSSRGAYLSGTRGGCLRAYVYSSRGESPGVCSLPLLQTYISTSTRRRRRRKKKLLMLPLLDKTRENSSTSLVLFLVPPNLHRNPAKRHAVVGTEPASRHL